MIVMSIIMNSGICMQRNRKGPKLFSVAGIFRFSQVLEVWIKKSRLQL
jgi:hypothetical protein